MMIAVKDQVLGVPARSFASLMELYENNYIFIRRLVPELERLPPELVSRTDGAADLHLSILERCPYTTTLCLTHCFEDGELAQFSPDLRVRIYHDARAAEVLPDSALERFRLWGPGVTPDPRSLSWRWEVNRFLYRWLHYCLSEGHRFVA